MSAEGKTRITGAKEIDKALGLLPNRLARKVMVQALRAGAKPMLQEARKGIKKRTGRTSKDLKTRALPKRESAQPAVAIGGSRRKGGREHIIRFLEFGTSKMPASPLLRPAFDNNISQSIDIVGKELGERIEKEAAKLAKK